jgi:hypothetical protein
MACSPEDEGRCLPRIPALASCPPPVVREENPAMTECACGCGERTAGGTFRPGHDQKLRGDLEERAGGLLRLRMLVDVAEAFAADRISLENLGSQVRRLFRSRGR